MGRAGIRTTGQVRLLKGQQQQRSAADNPSHKHLLTAADRRDLTDGMADRWL